MPSLAAFLLVAVAAVDASVPFWMGAIRHQGIASFNPDGDYQIFRNVKDFGAQGDGGESSAR